MRSHQGRNDRGARGVKVKRRGPGLRRVLGALECVGLDPVALEGLQDIAGTLEDGGNGSLIRLQEVLPLCITQLRLQQAQLGRAVGP